MTKDQAIRHALNILEEGDLMCEITAANWLRAVVSPESIFEYMTYDDVRNGGGIVHKDGNIFFTSLGNLNKAVESSLVRRSFNKQ